MGPAGGRVLTNFTMWQLGSPFEISNSAADRVIDHIAPLLALAPARRRHPSSTVLIVDGTHDRSVVASSKNYRYSTNLQVVIDANSLLVVTVSRPLPDSRHDARLYGEPSVGQSMKNALLLSDGGYRGTAALVPQWPHENPPLTPEQEAENTVHRMTRVRVEHVLLVKTLQILRYHRLRRNGVHQAALAIARLHILILAG